MKRGGEPKPFYESKTFWVSVLTILAGLGGMILDEGIVTSERSTNGVIAAIGFINMWLRFVTTGPVTRAKSPGPERKGG